MRVRTVDVKTGCRDQPFFWRSDSIVIGFEKLSSGLRTDLLSKLGSRAMDLIQKSSKSPEPPPISRNEAAAPSILKQGS
eukprot:CAMPEP_0168616002 /NCGR_PEP_ID=MMETSP0449_2-20121227/4799_1 /TAXON_ID=1082188 /ORGANISM="Strombidium rassoulzadegani, Strain ras09" /LENGTH=78 /DNA_ID=CAMNT_0008656767 /DNA_START=403 /DNA_END=639 /DNA_ORIENTATION=-